MEQPRARDPFALTADPQAYVPRAASEAALSELERALGAGETHLALTGPPGIGKTMLLRVLERRLADAARCIYLPYAALAFDDLCRWVLGLLGETPGGQGGKPGARLLAAAQALGREGRFLLVLLDDASALPVETARAWVSLAAEAKGALRMLAVPVDDGRAGRVLAALGPELVTVRYSARLSPGETEAFLRGRLEGAGVAPELLTRFDERLLARLHAASSGNPRRLQRVATETLRRLQSPEGLPPEDELDGELELDEEELAATGTPLPEARDAGQAGAQAQADARPAAPTQGGGTSAQRPTRAEQREAITRPPAAAHGEAGAGTRGVKRRGRAGRPVLALAVAATLVAVSALALRERIPAPEPRPPELTQAAAAPLAARPERGDAPPVPAQEPIPVHINAVPWAVVSVDGRELGATPLADVPLAPGPRLFRAELPDGTVLERTVEIGPTQRHVSFAPEVPGDAAGLPTAP